MGNDNKSAIPFRVLKFYLYNLLFFIFFVKSLKIGGVLFSESNSLKIATDSETETFAIINAHLFFCSS